MPKLLYLAPYLLFSVVLFIAVLGAALLTLLRRPMLPDPVPAPVKVDHSLLGRVERLVQSSPFEWTARGVYRALRRSGFTEPCSVRSVQTVLNRLVTNHHTVQRLWPPRGTTRDRRRNARYHAGEVSRLISLR